MIQKMIALILIINITKTAFSQTFFDSVSYEARYNHLFPSVRYGNPENQTVSVSERIAGLSKVWSEVKFGFANFDLVHGLNWDSAYQAIIPKVMVSQTKVNIIIF